MSINRVCISGNLTRDCEVKTLPSGSFAIEFGIAVNERRKSRDGEWEDYPNYVDCTEFTTSEKVAGWHGHELVKGAKVAIDGRLRYSSWEKDGQRRSKLAVIVAEIEFMTARKEGSEDGQTGHAGVPQTQERLPANTRRDPPTAPSAPATDAYDEDIPF